jgi:hypothetical protein
MHRGALGALLALPVFASWVYADERARARDAAEAVREGDVSQWLKYYERERGAAPAQQQPRGDPQRQGRPAPSEVQVPVPQSDPSSMR